MSRFGPDPRASFDAVYRDAAPWDIGEAQPAMLQFPDDVRDRFAAELAHTLPPGGRYCLLGFAVTFPIEHGPLQVDAAELDTRFPAERGWRILACRPAEFPSRVSTVPATAACIERIAPAAG